MKVLLSKPLPKKKEIKKHCSKGWKKINFVDHDENRKAMDKLYHQQGKKKWFDEKDQACYGMVKVQKGAQVL